MQNNEHLRGEPSRLDRIKQILSNPQGTSAAQLESELGGHTPEENYNLVVQSAAKFGVPPITHYLLNQGLLDIARIIFDPLTYKQRFELLTLEWQPWGSIFQDLSILSEEASHSVIKHFFSCLDLNYLKKLLLTESRAKRRSTVIFSEVMFSHDTRLIKLIEELLDPQTITDIVLTVLPGNITVLETFCLLAAEPHGKTSSEKNATTFLLNQKPDVLYRWLSYRTNASSSILDIVGKSISARGLLLALIDHFPSDQVIRLAKEQTSENAGVFSNTFEAFVRAKAELTALANDQQSRARMLEDIGFLLKEARSSAVLCGAFLQDQEISAQRELIDDSGNNIFFSALDDLLEKLQVVVKTSIWGDQLDVSPLLVLEMARALDSSLLAELLELYVADRSVDHPTSVLNYFMHIGAGEYVVQIISHCAPNVILRLLVGDLSEDYQLTIEQVRSLVEVVIPLIPPVDWQNYLLSHPSLVIELIFTNDRKLLQGTLQSLEKAAKVVVIESAISSIEENEHSEAAQTQLGTTMQSIKVLNTVLPSRSIEAILRRKKDGEPCYIHVIKNILTGDEDKIFINLLWFEYMIDCDGHERLVTEYAIQILAAVSTFGQLPYRTKKRVLTEIFSYIPDDALIKIIGKDAKLLFTQFPQLESIAKQRLGDAYYPLTAWDVDRLLAASTSDLEKMFTSYSEADIVSFLLDTHGDSNPLLRGGSEFIHNLFSLIETPEARKNLYRWNNNCNLLANAIATDEKIVQQLCNIFGPTGFYKEELLRVVANYGSENHADDDRLLYAVMIQDSADAIEVLKMPVNNATTLIEKFMERYELLRIFDFIITANEPRSKSILLGFLSEGVDSTSGQSLPRLFALAQHKQFADFAVELLAVCKIFSQSEIENILSIKNDKDQDIFAYCLYESKSLEGRLQIINVAAVKSDMIFNHLIQSRSPQAKNFLHDTLQQYPNFADKLDNKTFLNDCNPAILKKLIEELDSAGHNFLQTLVIASRADVVAKALRLFKPEFRAMVLNLMADGTSILHQLPLEKRNHVYQSVDPADLTQFLFYKVGEETMLHQMILNVEGYEQDVAILTLVLKDFCCFTHIQQVQSETVRNKADLCKDAIKKLIARIASSGQSRQRKELIALLQQAPPDFFKEPNSTYLSNGRFLFDMLLAQGHITPRHALNHPELLEFMFLTGDTANLSIAVANGPLKADGVVKPKVSELFQAVNEPKSFQDLDKRAACVLDALQKQQLSGSHSESSADRKFNLLRGTELLVGFGKPSSDQEMEQEITQSRTVLDRQYQAFLYECKLPHADILLPLDDQINMAAANFFSAFQIPGNSAGSALPTDVNIRDPDSIKEYLALCGGSTKDTHVIDRLIRALFGSRNEQHLVKLTRDMPPQPLLDTDWQGIGEFLVQGALRLYNSQQSAEKPLQAEVTVTEAFLRENVRIYAEHVLTKTLQQAKSGSDPNTVFIAEISEILSSDTIRDQFVSLCNQILTFYIDLYRSQQRAVIPLKGQDVAFHSMARVLDPRNPEDLYRLFHLPEIGGGNLVHHSKVIGHLAASNKALTILFGDRSSEKPLWFGYIVIRFGYIKENGKQYPAIFQNEIELAAYRSPQNAFSATRACFELLSQHFPEHRYIINSPYEIYLAKGNGGMQISESIEIPKMPSDWLSNANGSTASAADEEVLRQITLRNSLIELHPNYFA